jgi:FHA domain-containing protein
VSRPSARACPQGHASDDPDWCDVCGLAMQAAPAPSPAPAVPGSPAGPCAVCGAELDGRFCESCGHDSLAPAVPAPTPAPDDVAPVSPSAPPQAWWAVVRVDREWFDEVRRQNGVDAGTLEFPRYAPERRFALTGAQVAIGRRNPARGTAPELDLTGLDPGVSAAHAVLVARPDGGWEVVDVGSTNGTTLVLADGPLPAHRPVPLADGAVIHLGAWTTITVSTTP